MSEFKTAVEFVLGENPTPGGGTAASQTGDVIGIIAILLFALVAIASLGFFVYSNKKSGIKYGNYFSDAETGVMTKSRKIAIGAFLIAILALCGTLLIPNITKAMASNDDADETIKVYVDPETQTLSSDQTTIVNKTDKTAYVAAVKTALTPEAEEILKDSTFNLKIESQTLGTTLYDKAVPGVDDTVKSLPFASGQSAAAQLTISDLDFATAKLLIGIKVFSVSFVEAQCYTVTYDGNEATAGTPPAAQAKIPGEDLTLAATSTLEKEGYTLEGWNTAPDGTGDSYNLGAKYTTDADAKLYAFWKAVPVPPPSDEYQVTFTHGEGGTVDPISFNAKIGAVYTYDAPTKVFTFTNQDDASDTHTITASETQGYRFKEWQLNGSAVTTGGIVSETTEFKAIFEVNTPIADYTITYKVLNTFDPHGSIALNSSNEDPVPSVSETVTATHPAVGATASNLTDQPEHDYNYFFDGWTIEDPKYSGWASNEFCLTAEAVAALGLTSDTVFIAHFIAPVAKYTEENSTMIFSCDEVIPDGNYTFPVYNTNWDEEYLKDGDLSHLTYPAWCNYDGTQKVYPRNVHFLTSFKKYKGLKSTSFWFNTSTLLRRVTPSNDNENYSGLYLDNQELVPILASSIQVSVLTNVSGLENIFTENLTQTAFMFATDNGRLNSIKHRLTNETYLQSLDFSSWNINPKDENGNQAYVNMRSMFGGCSDLTKIDLPTEEDGHYFGTYANNLVETFVYCTSLQSISFKGNFGKYVTDLTGIFAECNNLNNIEFGSAFGENTDVANSMFFDCYSLQTINFNSAFGNEITVFTGMFNGCYNLTDINFGTGTKIGQKTSVCANMFAECENLRTIDLSSFVVGEDTQTSFMFINCNSLEEFKISDKWQKNMGTTSLPYNNAREGWFLNATDTSEGTTFNPRQIPDESGPGTFSMRSAKAIFNPKQSTFTFYYDSKPHMSEIEAGCTIYPVSSNCGFVTGQYGNNRGRIVPGKEELSLLSDNNSAFDVLLESTPLNSIVAEGKYRINSYILTDLRLPSWYRIDYANYRIENLLKTPSQNSSVDVVFDKTFSAFNSLYSTSCWFMADSDGYAPFSFSQGFGNIPTANLESSACMFGGFSFEMFKEFNYWTSGVVNNVNYDLGVGPYITPYLDTFNNTLTALDLSSFNISSSNSRVDYGALCANCKALTNVILPYMLCPMQESNEDEDQVEVQSVSALSSGSSILSFAGLFYGCESLTSIENIKFFNPFERLLPNFSYYSLSKMFYGCRNLSKIDFSNFNTSPIWNSSSSDYSYIFKECDKLEEITISEYWYIPMNSYCASLPSLSNYDIYWTKDGTGYDVDQIPYNEVDWDAEPDNVGKFTRDKAAIERLKQTVSIKSEDSDKGYVTSKTYTFYPSDGITISGSFNTIKINDREIIAIPNPGYRFAYWEVDGWLYDEDLWRYWESIEIVAHFEPVDYSAKAVYTKNNTKYDGDNTLTFYYDNVDHSLEGEVYEVSPNTFADTGNNYALLPAWFKTTYVAKADSGHAWIDPGIQQRLTLTDAVNYANSSNYDPTILHPVKKLVTQYSNLWKIQTLIEPKDVIFAENFKNYKELSSISMWFMADQFGTQTVQNFYSPVSGNDKKPGFANLYTKNLNNVQYAFGGLFEEDNNGVIWGKLVSPLDLALSFAPDEATEWSKNTETYGTSLESLDLTDFDLSHVAYLNAMFANCVGLKEIKFSDNLNCDNFYDCSALFANCENLGPKFSDSVINWSKFKTDKVTNFDYMFYGCSGIEDLDLSNLNTTNAYVWNWGLAVLLPNQSNSHDADYAAGYKIFSECTRLSKITINSKYDTSKLVNVDGWNLNLGVSGLADCTNGGVWKNLGSVNPWTETGNSKMIPYDYSLVVGGPGVSSSDVFSGTFTRSNKLVEKVVTVKSNDDDLGTVSDTRYGYINSVQIKADNVNEKAIYLDNRKITATPNEENARFAYWSIKINDDKEFAVPSNYNSTFYAENNDVISVTAVFVENEYNAYVAFSADGSGEGTFTFYYGEGTEEAASEVVPSGEELIKVFDVKPNTSDYDLPSWYRKYQESWYQGDNHPVPKFVREVEDNVDNNKLYVNFDESFAQYKELRSMSCWFMGALSHLDESVLFNPFCLDSAEHFSGLNYIDTSNISNVAYMFGGHEYFNELHGSKNTKITLVGFDTEGKISNLSGLFANLPLLTELNVDSACFCTMKTVTSTSKMFYNTPKLDKSTLTWLNTYGVTEMDYMFGNTVDSIPQDGIVDKTSVVFPKGFTISENVKSLEGFFSGYANCKELELDFSRCEQKPTTAAVTNMSYLFQNCCWVSNFTFIDAAGWTSSNVTNMSHMYENCTKIKNATTGTYSSLPKCLQQIRLVTDFSYMFAGCTGLEEYSINKDLYITQVVIQSASHMFANCTSLKTVAFPGYYYWYSNEVSVFETVNYPAIDMFTNIDGTRNTTLEHFAFDSETWDYYVSFYMAGLADIKNNIPIGWINRDTLSYENTRMLPSLNTPRVSNYELTNYDRFTTTYYAQTSDLQAWFDTAIWEEKTPISFYSNPFIGTADGYSISVELSPASIDTDFYQDIYFTITNTTSGANKTYAFIGTAPSEMTSAAWYYKVISSGATGKIAASGTTLPNEDTIIYFPYLPGSEPTYSALEVANAALRVFALPTPLLIVDLLFAMF